MDVRCERCKAQYVFDDDQVTPAGLTVQCTNCGHLFKVKKKELVVTVPVKPDDITGTPLPITAAAPRTVGAQEGTPVATRPSSPGLPAVRPSSPGMPAAEAPAREWRVRQANGNIFTFRELTTLQKWIIEQKVGRDDEISLSGDQWKRLGNIAELASFFQVVEAAERSRTQGAMPALTPVPHVTPMPMPAYGVGVQTPLYPPPPSGFPPPAFAAPPAPAQAPTAARVAEPPPAHDVDVTFADEAPPRRNSGSKTILVVAAGLVLAAGAAALVVPRLLEKPPAPMVVAPPPAPEPRPPPPEPSPPAPAPLAAPVPAPEPVVQEGPKPPPDPITQPARPAPPAAKGPKALLARARALQERGDTEGALELYGRVASDDPGNVEAQAGRGLCYLDLENWAPAEASFQAALRLEPDHADALLGLAETYRFQGKKAEAIPAYERYLARYPEGEDAQVAKHALAELRK